MTSANSQTKLEPKKVQSASNWKHQWVCVVFNISLLLSVDRLKVYDTCKLSLKWKRPHVAFLSDACCLGRYHELTLIYRCLVVEQNGTLWQQAHHECKGSDTDRDSATSSGSKSIPIYWKYWPQQQSSRTVRGIPNLVQAHISTQRYIFIFLKKGKVLLTWIEIALHPLPHPLVLFKSCVAKFFLKEKMPWIERKN